MLMVFDVFIGVFFTAGVGIKSGHTQNPKQLMHSVYPKNLKKRIVQINKSALKSLNKHVILILPKACSELEEACLYCGNNYIIRCNTLPKYDTVLCLNNNDCLNT